MQVTELNRRIANNRMPRMEFMCDRYRQFAEIQWTDAGSETYSVEYTLILDCVIRKGTPASFEVEGVPAEVQSFKLHQILSAQVWRDGSKTAARLVDCDCWESVVSKLLRENEAAVKALILEVV